MHAHTYTITVIIDGQVQQVFTDEVATQVSKTQCELKERGYQEDRVWGGLNEHGGNRWVSRYTNRDQRYSILAYEIVTDEHEPVSL